MPEDRPPPADRLPTLTEVVELQPVSPPSSMASADPEEVREGEAATVPGAEAEAPAPADTLADAPVEPRPADAADASVPPSSAFPAEESQAEPRPSADEEPACPEPVPAAPGGLVQEPAAPAVDLDLLAARVLQDISPRVEMLLQARLREALAPALARAAEQFMREARDPVALALNDLVHDAVARAVQRREDK